MAGTNDGLHAGAFRVAFAVGLQDRTPEYRLRHRAFAEEHDWEIRASDGLEHDAYDAYSCSTLLVDPACERAAACQRLVLPDWLPRHQPANVVREHRPFSPPSAADDLRTLPRRAWAEVSRLTIAPEYRHGSAGAPLRAMETVTYATLALAIALDRAVLFSMSDVRTARLSRRMGVVMHQIGAETDFHGLRATFRIDVHDVAAGIPPPWRPMVARLVEGAAHAVRGRVPGGVLPGPSSSAA